MLPLTYTLRNIFRSSWRSLQMLCGSAIMIFLILGADAFTRGMDRNLARSGDSKNVIILGAGSEESVERSEVEYKTAGIASSIMGLSQEFGRAAVSPEVHYNSVIELQGIGSREAFFRGINPEALQVHRKVRILEGRFPQSGEILLGRLAYRKLKIPKDKLKIGSTLSFEGEKLTIAGFFAAPGTVMESEMWLNLNDLMRLTQRDTLSCIVIRLDSASFDDVVLVTQQRRDLQLTAISETDYYSGIASFYKPLKIMAWLTAAMIAAGALFGGLNTSYAGFIARKKEMATLQAIGYSRRAIYLNLLQESLLINFAALLTASFAGLAIIHDTSVVFSSGIFQISIDHNCLLNSLILAIVLVPLGTLAPAWNSLAPALTDSLKS
jgi:putative ABC transport system permease protein